MTNSLHGYSVSKSLIESYKIHIESFRCNWARITLTEQGDLQVQSDCGDFAYSWRSFGESFKEFLIEVMGKGDTSYLYGKLSNPDREKQLDIEQMEKDMKTELLKYRRENPDDFSDIEARELWEDLTQLFSSGMDDNNFYFLYNDLPSSKQKVFGDDIFESGHVSYLPDMEALTFCEVVAPVFADILKAELQQSPEGQEA